MAITCTIAGVAKTLQRGTLWIQETVSGVDTFLFSIVSTAGTYRPTNGQEVIISDGGTPIMGGFIKAAKEHGPGSKPGTEIVTDVECVSYADYLNRQVATELFPAGTNVKTALTQLVTNDLAGFGIAVDAAQANGASLTTDLSFTDAKVTDIVAGLLVAAGDQRVSRVDASKKLRAIAISETAAPFNITLANRKAVGDIRPGTTRDDAYANYVIVIGRSFSMMNGSDSFTGDGVTAAFTLTRPIIAPPDGTEINGCRGYVMNAGVAETLGLSAATWILTEATGVITRSSPPANGNAITIHYDGLQTTRAVADGGALAADRVVAVLNLPDVTDNATAQAIADAELAIRMTDQQIVQYDTYETGLQIGMTQHITCSQRNLNGDYLITAIDSKDVNRQDQALFKTVTAALIFKGNFRKVLKIWATQGAGANAPASVASGAGSAPGAPDKSVQFNRGGAFGGDAACTFEYVSQKTLALTPAMTDTAAQAGLNLTATFAPTGTASSHWGVYNYLEVPVGNSQTINNGLWGLYTEARYRGSGTVQNLIAIDLQAAHTGGGALTNQIIGLSADVLLAGTATNGGAIGIRTTPSVTNVTATTPYVKGLDATATGNGHTTDVYGGILSALGGTRNQFGAIISTAVGANLTGASKGLYAAVDTSGGVTVTSGIIGADVFARTQSSNAIETTGVKVTVTDTGSASPTLYGVRVNVTGSGALYGLYVDGDAALQSYVFGATELDGSLIIGTQTIAGWGDDTAGTIFAITGGLAPTAGHNLNFIDLEPGSDTARTIPVGQSAIGMYLQPAMTTAASGTHPLINSLHVDVPLLTSGGATVTDAATLYVHGAPTLGVNNYAILVTAGASRFGGAVIHAPVAFGSLPTGIEGMVMSVNDANTATWGATIAGGGSNKVLAYYNGANWTVAGK